MSTVALASAGIWRLVMAPTGRIAGGAGAATRLLPMVGTAVANATGTTTVIPTWKLAAADFAQPGLTTKLRLEVELLTNATAPADTFTVGLYPLSSVAGAANLLQYTVGTLVAASAVAFTTPSASTLNAGDSGAFSLPADGVYVIAVVNGTTVAANAEVHMAARLEMQHV